MPSVAASVVLAGARQLLNDVAAATWTDTVLIPKLQDAHRELQKVLKQVAAPVMKAIGNDISVLANATTLTLPNDIVEPIRLWEKAPADAQSLYIPMTNTDPLPIVAQAATLVYWAWRDEVVSFIGASANRFVRMEYWKSLAVPVLNTDLLGITDAEIYLSPRLAALASLAVGEMEQFTTNTAEADKHLNDVIIANFGRVGLRDGSTLRP